MNVAVKKIKAIIRDQSGHALELALVLLAVGGLLSSSLLGYMGSGLLAGEVYESRTAELYAADTGVEDAMWKIQYPQEAGLPGCGNQWTYTYPEPGDPAFEVNGKNVTVSIEHLAAGTGTYKVVSVAAGDDSSTTITAYTSVSFLDFSGICDYAITSNGAINITGSYVDGDVYIPNESNLYINGGNITGDVLNATEVSVTWPTFDQLCRYYWPDVKHLDPGDPTNLITLPSWATTRNNAFPMGPYLADVDEVLQLEIKGAEKWLKLQGTLYVKGNFFLNPSINLDLNGQTIFATGNITLSPTTVLYGSGCIIARYNVNFQPDLSCEEGQYVLVLAIEGKTTLQPDSDFQGTVAGNVDVKILPGNDLVWVSPYGRGLGFPMGEGEYPPVDELSISSWEVSTG